MTLIYIIVCVTVGPVTLGVSYGIWRRNKLNIEEYRNRGDEEDFEDEERNSMFQTAANQVAPAPDSGVPASKGSLSELDEEVVYKRPRRGSRGKKSKGIFW
ncbi:hypothetical protein CYMTET_53879 [Cymbomonas tetramitiformis]|uniref:Uncharacterized protein n=1 Tax=Cymbomonas tetramitiformis TaxID=36881 RepID=A0AAE0BHW6_9CHLO|nr:hypothetical protein CYMTET_53879 [Cymbomonas tetramitiformis]